MDSQNRPLFGLYFPNVQINVEKSLTGNWSVTEKGHSVHVFHISHLTFHRLIVVKCCYPVCSLVESSRETYKGSKKTAAFISMTTVQTADTNAAILLTVQFQMPFLLKTEMKTTKKKELLGAKQ